jgi:ferrochelatase
VNQAVLLLAHGAPERLEDVESYLGFVRGGRPPNPRVTEEVKHRYAAIGGGSPLLRWTRAQAEALQRLLGAPVYFAMRNWHPFIQEVIPLVEASRVAAVCMAPQYSEMSIGLYMRKVAEIAPSFEISWARSYHDEPRLIEAFAEKIRRPNVRVLFTAHSLPERALAAGDPYDRECRATAALVAARLGLADWDFAYQSQGMTGDRWLGPTVESCLDCYAANGISEVMIAPIGFVCDHVEILYDIDIHFRDYAAARGITVRRPESLNDSPRFTEALAEVVKRCL